MHADLFLMVYYKLIFLYAHYYLIIFYLIYIHSILKIEYIQSYTHIHTQPTAQFSSVAELDLTLCNPMECSTPGLTVHHQLLEFTQTHVHCGEGNGNPLQYSCLENPMQEGAWLATVHGVMKSWTQLSNFTFNFYVHALEKEMATHSNILAWRKGAWLAAVFGVAQSRTWLTRLSSSIGMSIESVMPSNHLVLCRPLLLLPSIFPSIRVFSNESALHIRWPKYWNFSFNIRIQWTPRTDLP